MAEFDGGGVDEVALGHVNLKTTTAQLGGGASGGERLPEEWKRRRRRGVTRALWGKCHWGKPRRPREGWNLDHVLVGLPWGKWRRHTSGSGTIWINLDVVAIFGPHLHRQVRALRRLSTFKQQQIDPHHWDNSPWPCPVVHEATPELHVGDVRRLMGGA
uniref:Uncharacterized protein n=1 Tax=Oryza sativa subsp. japonica TaxID=39947 RepID=Q6UUC5_ORYSJ|nr:hypothetical protein OSJNBa0074N12.10 [Oryza sativa Japonica Group]